MKPDWKDAPDWAKYLAMDEDGDWTWFEREPEIGSVMWMCPKHGGRCLTVKPKKWDDTLEQRPPTTTPGRDEP